MSIQRKALTSRCENWISPHPERFNTTGVMLEWLKRHAWKACMRQKRIASSNLAHSALKP